MANAKGQKPIPKMNLIIRITILFAFISLIIFIIGGVISYNVMMDEIDQEQKHFLAERMNKMEHLIRRRPPRGTMHRNKMTIIPLDTIRKEKRWFSDTLVMHSQLDRLESHLKLEEIITVDSRSYYISIYDIIIEPDDIIDGVVESLVKMYLILLGAVFIVGFVASYYLLRPFNKTLGVIQAFSLTDPSGVSVFPESRVLEFRRLNLFLTEMTKKVRADYQSLKEFSENASHELQTPIAIVQGKLEVLLDANNLTEEQVNQISSIQGMIRRLSNLSHSLSLLTKIENNEFVNVSTIDLSETLTKIVDEFKELMTLKSIELEMAIESGISIEADRVLIELLLTNLVNNAIRHNWEKGNISVTLKGKALEIANSGPELSVTPDELFRRFKKSNQSGSSLGLGLAIVKKIGDHYGYTVEYGQEAEQHHLKVVFE